jgi:hypothetical protein
MRHWAHSTPERAIGPIGASGDVTEALTGVQSDITLGTEYKIIRSLLRNAPETGMRDANLVHGRGIAWRDRPNTGSDSLPVAPRTERLSGIQTPETPSRGTIDTGELFTLQECRRHAC